MADCEFVAIDGVWLPGVANVVRSPEYLIDAQRAISGMLRVSGNGTARSWRVELRGVPGAEVPGLLSHLMSSAAPRTANVMGIETSVLVTVDEVRHRPRIVRGQSLALAGDKHRVDVVLTLQEISPDVMTFQVFTASGTWDWEAAGSPDHVDVLLVAGGGGGGPGHADYGGGGGGAGGLMIFSHVPVSGDVTVTVGAGGTANGGTGGDSRFGSLGARGGSGGMAGTAILGGSGGGGRGSITLPIAAGSPGIAPQGHAGGAGSYGGGAGGGGGGGYTEIGHSAVSGAPGGGGDGVLLSSIGWAAPGAPEAVAGGGGGGGGSSAGAGGLGGGGAGGSDSGQAEDGATNTGGGGGGGGRDAVHGHAGGAGGSGLVIVRWRE